jgi:PAS domain S-box-containing protein
MQKEKELKLLFESDAEVLFSIDTISLKVTFISSTCKNIYGYDTENFYQDFDLLFRVVHPDFKGIFNIQFYQEVKEDNVENEFQIVSKNGIYKWVNAKVKPEYDRNGKLLQINGLIKDITELKIKEVDLENKINELNFYIYRITHDLRGPISSAQGLVYIAKREAKEEPLITYINKIEESNKKLDTILLNLIEVIRTFKGTTISKELINFESIISEILVGVEHNPKRKDIKIDVNINLFCDFYSDTKLISSILLNLVHNAINYHDKNSEALISIDINTKIESLNISVLDNGSGIPKEIESKVFDMFYRGNEYSKGSGLGLYIVKSAVEKLGGTIKLVSELGKGTTFSIVLPLS